LALGPSAGSLFYTHFLAGFVTYNALRSTYLTPLSLSAHLYIFLLIFVFLRGQPTDESRRHRYSVIGTTLHAIFARERSMRLKIAFGIFALLTTLALPALAQYSQPGYGQYPARAYGQWQRLSPEDQRDFDKYYAKWVDDTRKNDQDDIEKDTRQMQDIMARNSIPTNVPFEQIASNGHSAA